MAEVLAPAGVESEERDLLVALARVPDLPVSAIERLSADERAYADRLHAERRRRQYVGGRFLLRCLLERFTGRSAASHELHVDENGKPGAKGGPAVSIAHSADVIACAVARSGSIGIDVERIDRQADRRRIARHYFSAAENSWLESQPREAFYQLWVLKEAWLKMVGTGIAGGLGRLECRLEKSAIIAAAAEDETGLLSLFAWRGALIGLATDLSAQLNPIVLQWRTEQGALVPAADVVSLASGGTTRRGVTGRAA